MSRQSPTWYARRLRRMSPAELAWRAREHVRRVTWVSRQVQPEQPLTVPVSPRLERRFPTRLPADARGRVPVEARRAIVDTAHRLLAGRCDVLGVSREDLDAPDWFLDPVTGLRSDPRRYAFRLNHRSPAEVGNVKQVWELSRHHHLTVLAAAWFVTGDDGYARRVADQLRSWWRQNPFLSGVHWTSGIEVGIRLISWTWIRRLLHDWPGVRELFDDNDLAVAQIRWHQQYLAAFRSRGSSANNHVIAEAAGQLVASCALPWFAESRRWRSDAAHLLERELAKNTFPDGLNRELASDYQSFVAELGVLAAVEADAAGMPLSDGTWSLLAGMLDTAAALVDETLRPPRQGDGDDGRALVLDPPRDGRWASLLALGAAVVPRLDWWPHASADARSVLVGSLTRSRMGEGRPASRPSNFAAASLTLLRTLDDRGPEIWCRCDGGPHGYLSIAAHAHADALSVEVRVGGIDVFADPGTYCYHGDHAWRSYFRSTIGHNTVEVEGQDQSADGGPFLWSRHAHCRVAYVAIDDGDDAVTWCAEHDGYLTLSPPTRHRRRVRLDRKRRVLRIEDQLVGVGTHGIRMAYHLGPAVDVELTGHVGRLEWWGTDGTERATVVLPDQLSWSAHRGERKPPLGWYSPRFGQRVPSTTLLGCGPVELGSDLTTVVEFSGRADTQ